MLDLINKTLGKFFGTKTDRDLKELTPFVGAINNEFASLSTLSNDELRNFTITFKNTITERIAETDASIAQLQTDAEQNTDLDAAAKEDIYQSIDKLKKTTPSDN
jgi:preprotein translocase subunit SecA